MALVGLTSTHNSTNQLSQTLPFAKNDVGNHRDGSFPTFPTAGSEENHAGKVSDLSRCRKKEEDGEIGVFGAEKYFNGGMEGMKFECVKHEGVADLEPIKPVTHQGTPSVCSESSWNSQKALLQSVIRNSPKAKPSKVNRKSFLSGLAGCKCYCSNRNSVIEEVQVGEISFKRPANGDVVQSQQHKTANNLQVNKPQAEPRIKEDMFTFPTMGIGPVKVPLQGEVDEIGRKSLEVFGSSVLGRRNKALNLERRLKMLSWDATPKAEDQTEYSKANYINDTESEASSDLFEIESLTGKANPFLAIQTSEAPSGCVTPSEASIEWSVVTASAADFSVMSDYEELRPSVTLPSPIKAFPSTTINAKVKHQKEFQRRRSGGLLGCNSQKAVKVAGDAYKTNDKTGFDPRMRRVSDSYMPATRFRSETELAAAAGFEPAQTPRILATLSLPHSH